MKSKRLFNVKLNLSEYSNRVTMKHRRAKISNKWNSTEGLTKNQKYDKRCYVHTYIKYPIHARVLTSPVFADRTVFFFIFHAVCVSSQNSIEKFGKPTLMGIPVQCNPNGNRHFFPSNLWKPIANWNIQQSIHIDYVNNWTKGSVLVS